MASSDKIVDMRPLDLKNLDINHMQIILKVPGPIRIHHLEKIVLIAFNRFSRSLQWGKSTLRWI